ncbi:uncharacterized protein M6B38_377265 [Iris pallida]|uniref:Uncharacterized protein n=1 Tax=Iris pallida TaxID=29817 RepID=A0AAX6GBI9_IRIPA|nr:uncharacterized protein M6B38_377265 [Iris pallida]
MRARQTRGRVKGDEGLVLTSGAEKLVHPAWRRWGTGGRSPGSARIGRESAGVKRRKGSGILALGTPAQVGFEVRFR